MKKILLILATTLLLPITSLAEHIWVSPENIQAIHTAQAGDVILFREGVYRNPIVVNHLTGTKAQPILFRAAEGHHVVFDGTDYLNGEWKKVIPSSMEGQLIQKAQWKKIKGTVYAMKLKSPIYSLMYKGRLMNAARWPNSRWDDPWRLDRYQVLRRAETTSVKGELFDGLATENALKESLSWLQYDRSLCHNRDEMLADLNLSFKDAVVVMNYAWGSWATRVTQHQAGENHFKYDTEFNGSGSLQQQAQTFLNHRLGWNTSKRKFAKSAHSGLHFFLMGLPALDIPEEWWYDQESQTLFFITPDGKMPGKNEVQGKRRDFQITFKNCKHVILQGIDFYGVAASMENCTDSRIEDCNFKYSASEKFSIGNYDRPVTVTLRNSGKQKVNFGNALVNCQFSYIDGNAFECKSTGAVIDNILIYRTQQTTLGLSSFSMELARTALVRRVTINDVGASVGIRGGGVASVYELNNISRFGGLQYDGAAIQTGGRDTVIYRYNWSHDHPKRSFRFDAGGYPSTATAYGEMSYNVAWNTPGGYALKGDDHLLHNNLCLGAGGFTLFNMKRWASKNERTMVANNIVSYINAGDYDWHSVGVRKNNVTGSYEKVVDFWLKETPVGPDHPTMIGSSGGVFDDGNHKRNLKKSPILSVLRNNYYDDPYTILRDPDNCDFRLKDGVKQINGGYVITQNDVPWKTVPFTGTGTWTGKPNIGPYESNTEYYWIPGFKYAHASTPIPTDGTQTAKLDCDLMWLGGYRADRHQVFFGTSLKEVESAVEGSRLMVAELPETSNIVNLHRLGIALRPNHTYYWRVDAIREGKVIKGEVWDFTTSTEMGNVW